MSDLPGIARPGLQALPQIADRLTFLYLERCTLNRQDGSVTVTDETGCVHVPASAVSVLLLGPGTRVTHRAMELIGESGVCTIWVGEQGVRYYAGGRPLTRHSDMLLRQAALASNERSHLEVVRAMYRMRFPGEDVSRLTTQQLRGREGARIRAVYKRQAAKWNVEWRGREYDPDDFDSSDPVNRALSAGHACLYGLAQAVVMALGCSPGLGFVHVGHECSFVYDIADLYKADITIPLAFEAAGSEVGDVGPWMRRKTRDAMAAKHLPERMVHDIRTLLLGEKEAAEGLEKDVVYLWDERRGTVHSAVSYGIEDES